METPIYDFARRYAESGTARLHMPGHKGVPFLGCEALDLTEITGADSLYGASGIIARSEQNAAALFGSAATVYSTEGSSQCIRAMLYLALLHAPKTGKRPVIAAARNVHESFVLAAALLDFDVVWLWPESASFSLCSCPVGGRQVAETLDGLSDPPAAVYVTSPDYLGGTLDIAGIAAACRARGVPLLVDDAHGAYRHFLPQPAHPLDLGADICSDSAHKTLPVLTGGAYLHISESAPPEFAENARRAMALFGSTSPSYLILESLDLANRYLSEGYRRRLADCAGTVARVKTALSKRGWHLAQSDPLKLTVRTDARCRGGKTVAAQLRAGGVEYEYADPDFAVLMATPENTSGDFAKILDALGTPDFSAAAPAPVFYLEPPRQCVSIREAVLGRQELVPTQASCGRILAAPAVQCPPAVSVLISGERIGPDAVAILRHYGVASVAVTK